MLTLLDCNYEISCFWNGQDYLYLSPICSRFEKLIRACVCNCLINIDFKRNFELNWKKSPLSAVFLPVMLWLSQTWLARKACHLHAVTNIWDVATVRHFRHVPTHNFFPNIFLLMKNHRRSWHGLDSPPPFFLTFCLQIYFQ